MSIESKTHGVVDEVAAIGDAAMDKLGEVKEAAGEYYERGLSKAKELGSSFESHVKDKPIQSLLIAVGVSLGAGLLIGTLLRK